jgi:thioredoxin-dependent peroxiredoxin
VVYFAASCDEAERNREFAESLDLDYPILSDPGKKVAEKYGVVNAERPFPFRWTFYIGKDGKVLFIDKEVKPGDHGEAVVKQLDKLEIPRKSDAKTDDADGT